MKKLILTICAAMSFATLADAPDLQSGDVVQIGDFQWVVISKSAFEKMQAQVDMLSHRYDMLHSNETGRVALHGRQTHTHITNGLITVTYEDGYTISEFARKQPQMKYTSKPKEGKTIKTANKAAELTPWDIRRNAMKKRRAEALSKTNEVSVTVGR